MNILLTESSIETLAGGFAGICQVLVGHPFDTIKVCEKKTVKTKTDKFDLRYIYLFLCF